LYIYTFIRVNGDDFRARTFFLFIIRSSRASPSSKQFATSSKYFGESLNRNRCAYGRLSSMLVGSSLVSSRDRCSSRMFFFPSQMIMLNSNSWNNKNQRKIFGVDLPSTARSPSPGPSITRPEDSTALPLPREFFTHRLLGDLLFAYREIGSRDIARLATLPSCNQTPKPRSPMVNGQPRDIATRDVEDLLSQTPSVDVRCHVLYSTQSLWDPSQLALSRFLRAPFYFANAEMPSPESWGSRATRPSND
jgi:hypothetical protein